MSYTLGLTISYNSIGWALIDKTDQKPKIDMGVRVLQPSVLNIGEGIREQSTHTQRTHVRQMRKIFRNKRLRKQKLLSLLIDHHLCPLSKKDLQSWIETGHFPYNSLSDWLKIDPYALRAKAYIKKIELFELGRILFHISQRRGKCYVARESQKDNRIYFHGKPQMNRVGLKETLEALENDQTLGAYLADIKPAHGEPYEKNDNRIRNRYLDRLMYVDEFHKIYSFQQKFYPELTHSLRVAFGGVEGIENDLKSGVLFFQRPLKPNQTFKRFCPIEPNKKRTPKSHPEYEVFKVLKWINSIRCNGKPLSTSQREAILDIPFRFSQFSFKKIRKSLKLEDQTVQFNYDDTDIISLAYFLVHLSKPQLFGNSFLKQPIDEQIQTWHTLYFFDDYTKLEAHAKQRWNCSDDQAARLIKLQLQQGYGTYSLKAVRNITPFLKQGMRFDEAMFFAGLSVAIGTTWKNFSSEQREFFVSEFSSFFHQKKEKRDWAEEIKQKLKTHFENHHFDEVKFFNYNRHLLYKQKLRLDTGLSADQHIKNKFKPIAHSAIFELRKLVNAIIENYGEVDEIKAYVRPELKASRSSRKKLFAEKKRRAISQHYHLSAVHELGKSPTHLNILKHRLWEEFDRRCPYTSKEINIDQLFTNQVSVVHILPWNRFFNDSDINKALCLSTFKHHISDKTPWEYFSEQPTGTWEQVKIRVLKQLLNVNKFSGIQKFKQFTRSNYSLDAKTHEMTDTHHVSLHIKNILNQVCENVQMTLGHTTHNLREKWYLDRLDNFLHTEPINDQRRHAIDAMVTAVKTPFLLEVLSKWNRYENTARNTSFPSPWPGFKKEIEAVFETVQISFPHPKKIFTATHKTYYNNNEKRIARCSSARGQLHKELFYGKRKAPDELDYSYHIRKPIQQIQTAKHVQKIVDPEIKKRVYAQIDGLGGFVKGKIPKNCLTFIDEKGFTRSKITLPNRRGAEVPVRKVRIREQLGNAIQLHKDVNIFANSRNNHHVLVYENIYGELAQKVITFWTAVHRKKNKEPIWQLPDEGRRIVASLHINDCFLMGLTDEELANWKLLPKKQLYEHLYRVQRISNNFYEFRHVYDAYIYDTAYPNYIRILNFGKRKTGWKTYNPKKVYVDILGNFSDYKPFYKSVKQPQSQS